MVLTECDSGPGIALLGNTLAWLMRTGHETHMGLIQLVVEFEAGSQAGAAQASGLEGLLLL